MARALLLGFLVGFPIAAAPGPIAFLIIRRTLARGWLSGAISGLGVATGDALYAALAAFGITAITSVLISQKRWIGLLGGIAIIVVGARIVANASRPHPDPPPEGEGATRHAGEGNGNSAGAYLSILALTLSNPPTILSFAAVFAGLGLHVAAGWLPALMLVIGVFLGSAAWWLVLTGAATWLRARVTPAITRGIGIGSGILLIAFGVFTVGSAVLH
ncbi:MAG TPA: LysE family transporter [Candidatus Dormibacteraeota bacterium]|nr:LysE family transporter [Candidatus Dormibacteraeota bacterium]